MDPATALKDVADLKDPMRIHEKAADDYAESL